MSRVRPGGLALTRRVDSEHDVSRSQLRARGGSRGAGLHSGAVTGASRGPQHTGAWGRAGCGLRGLGEGSPDWGLIGRKARKAQSRRLQKRAWRFCTRTCEAPVCAWHFQTVTDSQVAEEQSPERRANRCPRARGSGEGVNGRGRTPRPSPGLAGEGGPGWSRGWGS